MGLDVEAEYLRRRAAYDSAYARQVNRSRELLIAFVCALAALAWTAFQWKNHALAGYWIAVPAFAAPALLVWERRAKLRTLRTAQLALWYERGLARLDGTEPQSGLTGEAFSRVGHLYERDLEILGPRSLFGCLATVRTAIGQEALASALLDPATLEGARTRQAAVRSLVDRLDLRERVESLGASRFDEAQGRDFEAWLGSGGAEFGWWLPWLLGTLTICSAAALVMLLSAEGSRAGMFRITLTLLLAGQGLLCLSVRERVRGELEHGRRLVDQVHVLRDGLRLMAGERFDVPLLTTLQQRASRDLGALDRLRAVLVVLEQREKEWFFTLSLAVGLGTHLAVHLSAWQGRHGDALRAWVAAWGEFETLLALATYAREHPAHVWPEIVEGETILEVEGLWHPLLSRAKAVPNNVALGRETGFLLISGSNMAGKSTLLRALGCNAVLAMAGAPVCAASLRTGALRVGASLALVDSLAEGRSKFLTEMERLRDLVAVARSSGGRLLFLVDEILSGTNSEDRLAAAAAVVRALREAGAIGALSTHDLALTVLAEDERLRGQNVHMASAEADDPLAFDYRLKPGINRTTNGLAIVRMLGLAVAEDS